MNDLVSKRSDYFKNLVIESLSDNLKSSEMDELSAWLNESEENRTYVQQIRAAWHISSSLTPSGTFDADRAWQNARMQLKGNKSSGVVLHSINYGNLIRIAAIFILAFLLGGAAMYVGFRNKSAVTADMSMLENEIVVPLGSKSQINLPDGTKVWLNAGSKLSYSQSYNSNHRDVYLEGEAFFNVRSNRQKPFVVKTPEMDIKAYGTSFNVKAYPEEGTVTTTLVEGIVKIESTNCSARSFKVSLKPNEKLTYIKNSFKDSLQLITEVAEIKRSTKSLSSKQKYLSVAKNIETSLYTSWKDEKWIIERETLGNLLVKLERRFNIKLICRSEALKNLSVSGTIRKETLEQFLDLLKLTTPLKYEINQGFVVLDYDTTRSETYNKVMN